MKAEERRFVDEVVRRVQESDHTPADTARRRFIDEVLSLVARPSHATRPATVGSSTPGLDLTSEWDGIVTRVEAAIGERFEHLNDSQQALVRAFEESQGLLSPLGDARYEPHHTQLIAWALRRQGGFGRALRHSFLELIGEEFPLDGWDVRAEAWMTDGSRPDVVVAIPSRWRCIIEVKFDAQERDAQLDDYKAHLNAACDNDDSQGTLVFLTPEGRRGKTTNEDHTPLAFRDLAKAWLPAVLGAGAEAAYLRLWLVELAHEVYGIGELGCPRGHWSLTSRARFLTFLNEV
ncbi:MAG: PD-(D/E)XK nuclease family protein [Deltaproteobacteria bacterium]|nr:PD-(D/E)XK nuclease family protein [Deltaproteobacteria bacterium]